MLTYVGCDKFIEDIAGDTSILNSLPSVKALTAWLLSAGGLPQNELWLTDRYAVYRNRLQPLGDKIVCNEMTIIIPDLTVPGIGRLHDHPGALLIPMSAIVFNMEQKSVSVSTDTTDRIQAVGIKQVYSGYWALEDRFAAIVGTTSVYVENTDESQSDCDGWHGPVMIDTMDPLHEAGDDMRADVQFDYNWKRSFAVAIHC